jgi:leucyl-tRNA synthetase
MEKSADWQSAHLKLAISEAIESLILLLAPAAPHSADEMWSSLGFESFTFQQTWPKHKDDLAAEDTIQLAVQVNGKLRDTLAMDPNATQEEMKVIALSSSKVQIHTAGKEIVKIVVVPGRLVNIVVKG